MTDQEKAALAAVTLANKTLEESRLWWESLAHKNRADKWETRVTLMELEVDYDKLSKANDDLAVDVPNLRRQLTREYERANAGVARIKELDSRVRELEDAAPEPIWEDRARDLAERIETADCDLINGGRTYQLQVLAENVAREAKEWDDE